MSSPRTRTPVHVAAGPAAVPLALALTLTLGWTAALAAQAPTPAPRPERDTARVVPGVVVTATRSERRLEDEPLRVEVISGEELEEKVQMLPGNVSMLLAETPGVSLQQTSASLGSANVRIQGLRGRYTQLLVDGLPLHGATAGGLGLLQIPPMDLAQVELVRGAASALYGPAALGGVVNFVSRRPAHARELLLNATSLGGADVVAFLGDSLGPRTGYTLLAGAHGQRVSDVDGDGWADLAGYRRAVIRPRLVLDDRRGRSLLLTSGFTHESRRGGALDASSAPAAPPGGDRLGVARADAGGVGRWLTEGGTLVAVRASVTSARHDRRFRDDPAGGAAERRERDHRATAFAEASAARMQGAHAVVLGAAVQHDRLDAVGTAFDVRFSAPALFVQETWSPSPRLALAASGRLDVHSEYGTHASPRLSLLLRPVEGWSVRLSGGGGVFAPLPLIEETEEVGLGRIRSPGRFADVVHAERARTLAVDVGGALAEPLEVGLTLFASRVRDPVLLLEARSADGGVSIANVTGEARTQGADLFAVWRAEPLHLLASWSLLSATEPVPESPAARRETPLTPRQSGSLVAVLELEEAGWKMGGELYYTGRQSLERNPYRRRSPAYAIVGALVERRLGTMRVFLNAENLLDVRVTRHHPLLLPRRDALGRATTDVWGPLEGRVLNLGVRLAGE